MKHGAKRADQITGPVVHVPPNVAVEPWTRDCRGAHRWRVVAFSFEHRRIRERCAACGTSETRTFDTFERREA